MRSRICWIVTWRREVDSRLQSQGPTTLESVCPGLQSASERSGSGIKHYLSVTKNSQYKRLRRDDSMLSYCIYVDSLFIPIM